MAGLLDNIVGDDTTKDQFGQTQADRREPLWGGLIRAGLLAVAGGGNLMPEQRAQYIAQAGGALADIPDKMVANKASAAQQMLRGQQLDEGKRKVADRDRIRALMQNPEMAQIVQNAKGADKIAIQAAIETGDIGALNTAIGNLDKAGVNAEHLANTAEKLKWEREKFAEQQAAKGGWGNSFEGRARDILKEGRTNPEYLKDPKNQVLYAQAYEYLSNERPVTVGNQTMILPKMRDIDDYPKPGAAPAPGSPTETAPKIVPPAANEQRENPDKSVSWLNPSKPEEVWTEYPDGTLKVTDANGRPIRTEHPPPPNSTEVGKLHDMKVDGAKFQAATQQFLDAWKNAPLSDRLNAIAGRPSDLTSGWTRVAAALKGPSLFNLGVLNAGDRPFITGALADPGKLLAQWGDPAVVERQVQKLLDIQNVGTSTYEKLVMTPPSRRPKPAAAGGGGAGSGYVEEPPGSGNWVKK